MKKIITIVGIILLSGSLIITPLLIKVKVDCKSQYVECPQQITDKLNLFNGKSLFSAKKGIRKILKPEYIISDYSLQFKIPNILRVELLVKKAVAAFTSSKSDTLDLVDNEGKVLSTVQNSALPTISIEEDLPTPGQSVSAANLFALNLASGIYQMYQVGQSHIQDGSLLVELPGQIRVIFPLDGDSEILLGSLRLIYSKIKEDGNLAGYSQIDLRFKNPVLR